MRKIVAVLAVLALASTASAVDQVWFVASGGPVVQQGAPGVSTILGAPGIYTIDVYLSAPDPEPYTLMGFDIGLKGPSSWSSTLGTDHVCSPPAGRSRPIRTALATPCITMAR